MNNILLFFLKHILLIIMINNNCYRLFLLLLEQNFRNYFCHKGGDENCDLSRVELLLY